MISTTTTITLEKKVEQKGETIDIEAIMDREQQKNKNDVWSKIDKPLKLQKLHAFSEKYGKEHNYSMKDIKSLKTFFINALERGKLQKTKDVQYDKETKEIVGVPGLVFDSTTHNFTLKNLDSKRVSTLKSLTPRKSTFMDEK